VEQVTFTCETIYSRSGAYCPRSGRGFPRALAVAYRSKQASIIEGIVLMKRRLVLMTILGFLAASLPPLFTPSATAATLSPFTFNCFSDSFDTVYGSVGDTVEITLVNCSGRSLATTTSGVTSWRTNTVTDPSSVTGSPFVITVSLLGNGVTHLQIGGASREVWFYVSTYGRFDCSVAGIENTTFTGSIGETVSFTANGSCNLSVLNPGIVSWRDTSNSSNPSSVVNDVVFITLIAEGSTTFTAQWPNYPSSGRQLNIAITSNVPADSSDNSRFNQLITLSLGLPIELICTDPFSGFYGSWIQLTGTGCTAALNKTGIPLLGWSTSPEFPVDIARNVVAKNWGAYEIYSAGRLSAVFIPLNGYTQLSSNNTIYPIWG
jgi:hypothetical protein